MHHSGFLSTSMNAIKSILNEKEEIPQVSGLRYIENWMDSQYATELIKLIDSQKWDRKLSRRTQEYGPSADHLKRSKLLNQSSALCSFYDEPKKIPDFLKNISQLLLEEGIFSEIPNQIMIDEYSPGQGISPHTDNKDIYSGTIASLSLGSSCIMIIKDKKGKTLPLPLKPNSLLILKGKARYECEHGIRGQVYDVIDSVKVSRSRRVSITFRKTI